MSNYDPRSLMATSAMTRLQIIVCFITVVLNALDGFDVLAISFATPGILKEWNINRAEFGIVASMELWGMAVGSFLLGSVAAMVIAKAPCPVLTVRGARREAAKIPAA